MGAVEWWRRFVAMPDRERAKLLALVLGGIIIGVLYALGGLSLYLRSGYLTPVPAPLAITRLGAGPAAASTGVERPPELGTAATLAARSADRPVATLYPTVTPDLTRTAMAVLPAAGSPPVESLEATPFPTPTDAAADPAGGPGR